MLKKGLAVAVILLFIGVAFAPSINSSVIKDELVEFDVELCGLGQRHTVSLTQQEAHKVELLFDDIQEQLNNVETREEAEEIFKDAVVELDNYGVLGDVSVMDAIELVNNPTYDDGVIYLMEALSEKYPQIFQSGNYLCSVAGSTANTEFSGIIIRLINIFSSIQLFLISRIITKVFELFVCIGTVLMTFLEKVYEAFPLLGLWADLINRYGFDFPYNIIPFLSLSLLLLLYDIVMVTIGSSNLPWALLEFYGNGHIENKFYTVMIGNDRWGSADGWIETIGKNGNVNFTGDLWGHLPLLPHFVYIPSYDETPYYSYPGMIGFKGIVTWNEETQGRNYLGNAVWVDVREEYPDNPWIP